MVSQAPTDCLAQHTSVSNEFWVLYCRILSGRSHTERATTYFTTRLPVVSRHRFSHYFQYRCIFTGQSSLGYSGHANRWNPDIKSNRCPVTQKIQCEYTGRDNFCFCPLHLPIRFWRRWKNSFSMVLHISSNCLLPFGLPDRRYSIRLDAYIGNIHIHPFNTQGNNPPILVHFFLARFAIFRIYL